MDLGLLGLLGAFAAGVLSFVSPCVFPLIPAYLAQLTGMSMDELQSSQDEAQRRTLMTNALAFVVGLMPLVLADGAGANARRSLGTVVVGGLFLATVLIIMVPIFYYVIERLRERRGDQPASADAVRQPAE